MIELTLLALLNTIGDKFCEYRSSGFDTYKSLLLSYSDASEKYGIKEVKNVIENSSDLRVAAVAIAVTKCPHKL